MKVLLCNKLHYPAGDAGSIRQHKLAWMLRELGHDVFVVGLGPASDFSRQVYGKIPYVSLRQGSVRFVDKALSQFLYWHRLKKILKRERPDALMMDDLGTVTTVCLKRFCKKRRILLIHDSVEWYSAMQFPRGKWSLGYIKKDLMNRHLIGGEMKVIAISRYLEDHFRARGLDTVRIPIVILDEDLRDEKILSPDRVVFTYAGQPGKKDFLPVMVEALRLLPGEIRNNIAFNIVGCNKQQMLDAGFSETSLSELEGCLRIHGRVSHDRVLELLRETNFTMLIRNPEERYAKAGFPSKVVESLANSTPVLCNLSSDLGLYLRDGENAILASDHTPQAVALAMERAAGLSFEKRKGMCKAAHNTAKVKFDYRQYQDALASILK